MKILAPKYMEDFKCIGGACEDTCCSTWTIHLDKDIYNRYRNIKNPELKNIIRGSIGRDRSTSSDRQYGKINLDDKGMCPLLDEDGLCNIQKYLGPEGLSTTCREYPRYYKKIDGGFELSANLSCPQVARLVLFEEDGMEFVQMEGTVESIGETFDTEGHLYLNRAERYFWEIRMFSLTILQFREYSLSDRLIILGLAYHRIEKLEEEGRAGEIPAELENFILEINNKNMDKMLSGLEVNEDFQVQLLNILINKRLDTGVSLNQTYIGLLEDMINGFIISNSDDLKNNFIENRDSYLNPYLYEKEYILENFLVNEFFRTKMPFKRNKNLWQSYVEFCVLYIIVKIHLVGIAGHYKEMNDDLIHRLIYSFSRVTLHNDRHLYNIMDFLQANGMDTLAYITILLKE